MSRFLVLTVGLALLAAPAPASADDAIAPEILAAVKKAAVFIRVEGDSGSATGSGFVVRTDGPAVLIATNHHVAAAAPGAKPARITVVFDAGTAAERSYPAAVVASDLDHDLAVLRVASVKDAPAPIAPADSTKLTETMPVYTFGYPFGNALATDRGSPAVTVGKASISSLRNGPDGELAVVQIDGNLNPGNSGGPVVDARGRLVGVAKAIIRDGPGIGLVIPASELVRTMQGRTGKLRLTAKNAGDNGLTVRFEADLIDPVKFVRGATIHYVVVPLKGKRPTAAALETCPGCTSVAAKIQNGTASAEFPAPSEGEILVQVQLFRADSSPTTTAIKSFSLTPSKPIEVAGPPPVGWKEFVPQNKSFVMWVPEKPQRQSESNRISIINGQHLRINTMSGKTVNGLTYQAEVLLLPPVFARVPRKELYDLFRGAIVSEVKGRVTDSKEAKSGTLTGAEYLIEAGPNTTRVRMYITGARVLIVLVMASAEAVAGSEAETILSSFRLPKAPVASTPPGEARPAPRGADPKILAGAFDPQFKDMAPDGGLLVGFEIGLGKFLNSDIIKAARPIFRVGDKETFGEQHGTELTQVMTVKAKPGYAVGAITAMHGLMVGGFSVTFMKVADGKLDPTDSYESEWVGSGQERRPTKLGGDGTPVVGIVGKSNAKDMTGMGLLFKGQEAWDPAKK